MQADTANRHRVKPMASTEVPSRSAAQETAHTSPVTGVRIAQLELSIPLRWGDMDMMGHVSNTYYFRYMDEARVAWFERIGSRIDPTIDTFVVVHAACDFLIPLVYPGTVRIRMYRSEFGRSSLATHYDMAMAGDARVWARGVAKLVWMSAANGRSRPIPEEVKTRICAVDRADFGSTP